MEKKKNKIEAAVDSGACDVVANPADLPDAEVTATKESRSKDHWNGAGGGKIAQLGGGGEDKVSER